MKKALLVLLIGVFMGVTGFSQVDRKDHKPGQNQEIRNRMPSFRGGDIEDFRVYIQKTVKYPAEAVKEGVMGTVYVRFTVSRKGKVTKTEIVRSVEDCLDNAVLEVVKNSPDWDHAHGRSHTFTVPVNFVLK